MKPAAFAYHAPTTVDEALALLAEHGDEAKVLAGGQSLVPAMSFRLARPAVLVDLNRLPELAYVRPGDDGGLRIGTMTRQRTVETSPEVARRAPLVAETLPWVAHPQIRNRGTFGGSIAHADPAAELPAAVIALEARCRVRSQAGERWIAGEDFYTGLFATALAPGEMLVEVALPATPPGSGWAFLEVARRHGDYALVGIAATLTLDGAGRCRGARIVLVSVGEGPFLARRAAALLAGEVPSEALLRAAAEAVHEDVDPPGDIHASAAFRRRLAAVLTGRALRQAVARARPAQI